MFRVLSCLTTEHDWRLVALAGIVCFLSAVVVISLLHRARASAGNRRAFWLAVGATAAGCGIWATHFIAMSLSSSMLAMVIAGGATTILGTSLVAALSDRQTEDKVNEERIKFDVAFANMPHGLCMFDREGNIVLFNERYAGLMEIEPDFLRGRSLLDLFKRRKETGAFRGNPEEFFAHVLGEMRAGRQSTRVMETADGRALRVVDQPMACGGWIATFEDITEWRKAQNQIAYLARHDSLTKLPNRTAFRDEMEQALQRLKQGEQLSVLCLDPDQLLKNADMALYLAKGDGRGTYRFFEPGMDARAQARRILELDLRNAVRSGEFALHYQPIRDLRADRITCFEALVRWNHPQRGMIPPLNFIPLAEETGLIVPIGEWVLQRACRDAVNWPSHVCVAVNLSSVQFRNRNLISAVQAALAESGLAPERLELEITESVLLQDSEATLEKLHLLRKFGVRISMDDFGTGYSSLSYLRSFPFDKIKIDRSFIHELATRDDSMAIVRAVTGLGKSLGISTTAEGVETEEQLEILRQEGCTEVQGYLFSPPRPLKDIESLLMAERPQRCAVA